jgi:uroporphyrinogen-III decarboxylase
VHKLTMRERMLAVVQGREVDRIPFVQYSDIAAPNDVIWDVIGRENMGLFKWTMVHRIDYPNCPEHREPIEANGLRGERTTLETPKGTLTQEKFFDPTLNTAATRKHFVTEPHEYEAILSYFQDGVVVEDLTRYNAALAELGDDGLPLTAVLRTPFQQMWVQWVNIQDMVLHMLDFPDIVDACFQELLRLQSEVFKIVAKADIPFINFPDNITAPLIGEPNFRKYCVPAYQELNAMLADRDIPAYCHMDGDLKPLWEAIGESGLRGIDSFSPPPDNDTSPADVVRMWPEMRMHLNFPSSVHLTSEENIYNVAMDILEQAGHTGRLLIQISENVPPEVWRKSYPQIVRAINDFGKPKG